MGPQKSKNEVPTTTVGIATGKFIAMSERARPESDSFAST